VKSDRVSPACGRTSLLARSLLLRIRSAALRDETLFLLLGSLAPGVLQLELLSAVGRSFVPHRSPKSFLLLISVPSVRTLPSVLPELCHPR
jgi:hypothetical protein